MYSQQSFEIKEIRILLTVQRNNLFRLTYVLVRACMISDIFLFSHM